MRVLDSRIIMTDSGNGAHWSRLVSLSLISLNADGGIFESSTSWQRHGGMIARRKMNNVLLEHVADNWRAIGSRVPI